MIRTFRSVVVGIALSLVAASGWAEDLEIQNFGFSQCCDEFGINFWRFELDPNATSMFSGFNFVRDAGWFNEAANPELSDDGAAIAGGSNGAFRQQLTTKFQSNTTYTLQFDIGAPDRTPNSFRTVTDYQVSLWRGGTLGEWNSGIEMFEANDETFGGVSTTAGAGGVWKHVEAIWITGALSQEVLDSFIQVRVGEAGPYGVFDNIQLSVDPAPAVPGDYNGNGVVDAADYVLWRDGGPLENEVADPGTVSPDDYTAWRARFGNTSGGGSSTNFATAPEPSSIFLLLISLGALTLLRRLGERIVPVTP